MALAACLNDHEGALRADLQQTYGINLDDALNGACSVVHLAALVDGLPPDARIRVIANDDAAWTLETILLADIRNHLAMILWALGSGKNRPKPALIGASWMRSDGTQKLEAQVMTIDELMAELAKPRGGENG